MNVPAIPDPTTLDVATFTTAVPALVAWLGQVDDLDQVAEAAARAAVLEDYLARRAPEAVPAALRLARSAEVRIGELLGPAVDGRPRKNSDRDRSFIAQDDRRLFRLMYEYRELAWDRPASRRQILADIARKRRSEPTAEDRPASGMRTMANGNSEAPGTLKLITHEGQLVDYPRPSGKATFNRTNEQISWAAWSWNPVTGCLHGCAYCYARELANRASYRSAYPVGFTPLFHHERLDAPANTPVPARAQGTPEGRVFVCSMADLYGRWVPQEWVDRVHEAALANPQWEYLFLTKFPSRYLKVDLPATAWVGTSVDTQRRVSIAEGVFGQLSGVRVKWLSLEPLLEPLEFGDLSMFDWVVIGAQSETVQPSGTVPAFAPPFEWVARIVAQAREAGCAIYMKPNLLGHASSTSPGMRLIQEAPLVDFCQEAQQ